MRYLAIFLFLLASTAFAAEGSSGNEDSQNSEALYQKAEQLEWYRPNNMKEVDKLYEKAANAGNDSAKMMHAFSSLTLEDPQSKEFDRKMEELCSEMEKIANKWGKTEDPDQNFHLARYFALHLCKNRNPEKARALLEKSALAGNAKSQFYQGRRLAGKDDKASFEWFAKSADQGLPQALAYQGSLYLLGRGVKKDSAKGKELIEKALASGNPNACYQVAIWYLEGKAGLTQNEGKAQEILAGLAKDDYLPAIQVLKEIENSPRRE